MRASQVFLGIGLPGKILGPLFVGEVTTNPLAGLLKPDLRIEVPGPYRLHPLERLGIAERF